jgi:vacuolar-type H+-ATPase subunit I/STV1
MVLSSLAENRTNGVKAIKLNLYSYNLENLYKTLLSNDLTAFFQGTAKCICFWTIRELQYSTFQWMVDYNENKPHKALNSKTPIGMVKE